MKTNFILALILLLFYAFDLKAQNAVIGLPHITELSENSPEAQITNWAVECDKHGIIYVGNELGVLCYDGDRWIKIFKAPNNTGVKSLKIFKNRIFVGMNNDFGFLERQNSGIYLYQSLKSIIKGDNIKFTNIWNINALGSRVVFQCFEYLFILENEKITQIAPTTIFHNLFVVNNKIYVKQFEKGIYELNVNDLILIPDGPLFADKDIFGLLPYKNDKTLIFTGRDGIFETTANGIIPWKGAVNEFFKKNPIMQPFSTKDGRYIVGTSTSGLVVFDNPNTFQFHINKANGLKSNTILDIQNDNAGNIVIATENSIEFMELSNQYTFLDERVGLDAKVNDFKVWEDKIYVATNQGVFISSELENTSSKKTIMFEPITNIKEQIWKLSIVDNQIYALTHTGAFVIKKNQLIPIQSDNHGGVWVFKELKNRQDIIIEGTYTGINVFKKGESKLQYTNKIEGFSKSSRVIEIDSEDNIWVAHYKDGLFKLSLSSNLKEVRIKSFFVPTDSMPANVTGLTQMNGKILAVVNGLIYQYNQGNDDTFVLLDELNKSLIHYMPITSIQATSNSELFYVGGAFLQESVGLINITNTNIQVTNFPSEKIRGKLNSGFEYFGVLSTNLFGLTLNNGILLYAANSYATNATSNFNTVISNILINNSDTLLRHELISNTKKGEKNIEIPYKSNTISFNFFSPSYNPNVRYATYLEGLNDAWGGWLTDTKKEFSNLSEGKYTFWVKAKNPSNETSEVAYFKFTILPPWYRTIYAYIFYLALLIIAIIGFFKIQQILLKNKARKVRYTEILRDQQKRKRITQERIVAEMELAEMKNSKLKTDLEIKNKEVTNSAIHVLHLNETLNEIQNKLKPILTDSESRNKSKLRDIVEQINYKINKTDDWDKFEFHLNQIHQGFSQRLKSEFPDLSTRELRLCSYLRMNLSSKEIAPLLGINYRSVEALRYRTRKRLNLSPNQSLLDFIITF